VTIVSIGTTLPELITEIMAVRRGQTDLALGNALGSCLFDTGAAFGVAALVSPPRVDATFIVPLVYMGVLAIALVPMTRTFGRTLSRREGALLLASYAAFLAYSSSALGSR
jgi:cation:H+ antiporter